MTSKLLTVAGVVAVMVTGCTSSNEIVVDGIRYRGEPSQISRYSKARKNAKAALKRYEKLRRKVDGAKGDKKALMILERKMAIEIATLRPEGKERDKLERQLVLVPTFTGKDPSAVKPETMRQLFKEADKLKEIMQRMKREQASNRERRAWLEKTLQECSSHPAESTILVELGMLSFGDVHKAELYFSRAIQCKFPSDRWDLSKQRACQELARLYEKQKKYGQAIDALTEWKVAAPYGEGVGESRLEKRFWIFRLSMHFREPVEVRKEMWGEIIAGRIYSGRAGGKILAAHVCAMYTERQRAQILTDYEHAKALAEKRNTGAPNEAIVLSQFLLLGKALKETVARMPRQ